MLPDEQGTILNLGTNLRKDNSDLKTHQLFVGSEGQLGIITRASILVAPKPTSMKLVFLGMIKIEFKFVILQAAIRLKIVYKFFEQQNAFWVKYCQVLN